MIHYEQVPLSPAEDVNPQATTWLDGKCVKLDEGQFLTYYVRHHTEHRLQLLPTPEGEQETEVEICLAAPVRIPRLASTADLHRAAGDLYTEVLPLYVADHMESYRADLVSAIHAYDRSKQVNEFFYQGQSLWLSREDRIVVKDRFEREQAAHIEMTHLVFNGYTIEVTPASGLALINAVATYADQCFDVTQLHLQQVANLSTPAALLSFDITAGYPPKLNLS